MKNEVFGLSPVEAKYTVEQMRRMIVSYLADKSGVYSENVKPQCSFRQDLSLDSLDRVEMFMWCEAKFNIVIHDDEIDQIDTVRDLFQIVESKGRWVDKS